MSEQRNSNERNQRIPGGREQSGMDGSNDKVSAVDLVGERYAYKVHCVKNLLNLFCVSWLCHLSRTGNTHCVALVGTKFMRTRFKTSSQPNTPQVEAHMASDVTCSQWKECGSD